MRVLVLQLNIVDECVMLADGLGRGPVWPMLLGVVP